MEIQQALIQAGYLHQDASAKWDDATRAAMRRYQEEHGFPTTGLPEAKSLMNLGLGPHPLPEDVQAATPSRLAADPVALPRATTKEERAKSTRQ